MSSLSGNGSDRLSEVGVEVGHLVTFKAGSSYGPGWVLDVLAEFDRDPVAPVVDTSDATFMLLEAAPSGLG
jgi:hypothetical protein